MRDWLPRRGIILRSSRRRVGGGRSIAFCPPKVENAVIVAIICGPGGPLPVHREFYDANHERIPLDVPVKPLMHRLR